MQAIERHLTAGGQVIVFLNRRGYAPCLFCNACGWVAPCAHCDARMTLHRRAAAIALPPLRRHRRRPPNLR
jgi:primosomal protein N' (replication factor Y)